MDARLTFFQQESFFLSLFKASSHSKKQRKMNTFTTLSKPTNLTSTGRKLVAKTCRQNLKNSSSLCLIMIQLRDQRLNKLKSTPGWRRHSLTSYKDNQSSKSSKKKGHLKLQARPERTEIQEELLATQCCSLWNKRQHSSTFLNSMTWLITTSKSLLASSGKTYKCSTLISSTKNSIWNWTSRNSTLNFRMKTSR